MKKLALGVLSFAIMSVSGMSMAAQFVEGKDYTLAPKVGKVDVPSKIEVREFFWYGCGHCYSLEHPMQQWLQKLPKDVNFVRTPAVMGAAWEANARGYYVSEALGIRRKAHIPLFNEIHKNGKQLFDQKSLSQFYVKYGADEKKFNSLYNSFSINGKIKQAYNLAMEYQLSGVPAVVVNGKYIVQGDDQKVVDVVNYLIEKERK